MDLEQIKREMLRCEIKRLFDISLPAGECLTRQPRDQIETYICKTRVSQISKSSQRISGVMRSAELRELGVIESLCAKAGAINSETAKRTQLLRRRTSRINLQRNLRFSSDLKLVKQAREDALQLCRRQQ